MYLPLIPGIRVFFCRSGDACLLVYESGGVNHSYASHS